jgi:hypothetical protein
MTGSLPCSVLPRPRERADAVPANRLARPLCGLAVRSLRVSVGACSADRSLRPRRNRLGLSTLGAVGWAKSPALPQRVGIGAQAILPTRTRRALRRCPPCSLAAIDKAWRSLVVRRRRAVGSEQADRRHQACQLRLPAGAGLGKHPAQVRLDRVRRQAKPVCRFRHGEAR